MSRKGIILAGGYGTRLYPSTKCISKQIIPVYDKPMIYYPLSTLMEANIRDILIISTPNDMPFFQKLLDDGSQFGISIQYEIQDEPKGIAQAFIIGENFINGHPSCLILGDNIFYGAGLPQILQQASNSSKISTIFSYKVNDPHRFGVVEMDANDNVLSIEEKPIEPKSKYAVTGLYFYDKNASKYAKELKPSYRGELEITDLNNIYLRKNMLKTVKMSKGYAWLDTGTPESLLEASNFIHTIEKRQGSKISCPEEIALENNWVNPETILKNINKSNSYNDYIKTLINEI